MTYTYIIIHGIRIFFGGGRGLNLKPYIYYALSLTIELSSQGHTVYIYNNIRNIQ
jgi:hypothetical protein